MKIEVNTTHIRQELDKLATYSDVPNPAVTRVVFSATDLAARRYVKHLCTDAGLEMREDAAGNTFARWVGREPTLPAIGTGSHIDAIPNAGMFDGTVGVIGGLEAIRALKRSGFRPRRSIELLIFTAEEPTRFGIGCLGSRLLGGALDPATASQLRDENDRTFDQIRGSAGFTEPLADVALPRDYYAGFIELHIEQGPILEAQGIPVGVVTNIAAPASLRLTIRGQGGHAGAVLMPDRHDAFCAAAEIALGVESAAKTTGAIDTVATAGMCEVFPGAINSIPSWVRISLDIRDTDEARRDGVVEAARVCWEAVSRRRGVTVEAQVLNSDAPAACDPKLIETLIAACETHHLRYQRMVSRAYHDTLFLARVAPTAMLFVPCREGLSHRPDEYTSPEAIGDGVLVLAEALAQLAGHG